MERFFYSGLNFKAKLYGLFHRSIRGTQKCVICIVHNQPKHHTLFLFDQVHLKPSFFHEQYLPPGYWVMIDSIHLPNSLSLSVDLSFAIDFAVLQLNTECTSKGSFYFLTLLEMFILQLLPSANEKLKRWLHSWGLNKCQFLV